MRVLTGDLGPATIVYVRAEGAILLDRRLSRDDAKAAVLLLLPGAHPDAVDHWLDRAVDARPPRSDKARAPVLVTCIALLFVTAGTRWITPPAVHHAAPRRPAVTRRAPRRVPPNHAPPDVDVEVPPQLVP